MNPNVSRSLTLLNDFIHATGARPRGWEWDYCCRFFEDLFRSSFGESFQLDRMTSNPWGVTAYFEGGDICVWVDMYAYDVNVKQGSVHWSWGLFDDDELRPTVYFVTMASASVSSSSRLNEKPVISSDASELNVSRICEKPVIIKKYNSRDVFAGNHILFNTNNHYINEGIEQPPDYFEKQKLGNTCNWIDKFHPGAYHKIILDKSDLEWMRRAWHIGHQTFRFSHLFDEELEETCQKYKDFPSSPGQGWFVRTDKVSLKYGIYGCGPYDCIKDIIKSMVTTIVGHECFYNEDETCPIYLMNWKDINPDKEFRIFVYKNEITALSNQNIFSPNSWLQSLKDDEIKNIVYNILDFFETNIKDKLTFIESYTMDLAILNDGTPYFIEPNAFGKYYAAGSSLFHWVNDHDKLHDNTSIELRFSN